MRRALAFGVLVSVVIGGCTGVQTKPIAGGDSVIAEAPVLKPGDEWRYTGAISFGSRQWTAISS
jgi:uncharacterized protein affecting Mg2+/Co2+ transport